MNPTNIELALSLLIGLVEQLASVAGLIKTAQASGVDITSDQLDQAAAQYTAAATQLNADIATAKTAGK